MKDEEEQDEDGFIFIPPCFVIPRKGVGLPTSGSAEGDMWAMKMTVYTVGGGLFLAIIIIAAFSLLKGC